jgi:DNA-binding transcriptional MocR family regulator
VQFCLENNIILAHDIAYSEIAFDGYRAPSVLEADGARECAIEFHSLSKTYSMTGWRVGFAVGNERLIGALGTVKTNIDSGVFQAVQEAAIAAFDGGDEQLREYCAIYKQRRDLMVEALHALGLECDLLSVGQGAEGLYLSIIYRTCAQRNWRRDYAGFRIWQKRGGLCSLLVNRAKRTPARGCWKNQGTSVVTARDAQSGFHWNRTQSRR